MRLKGVLVTGQLTASAVSCYTATVPGKIVNASFCNTDTVDRTVTAHIVPLGGSATSENMVLDARTVPTADSILVPELMHAVNKGDRIMLLASAVTAISVRISIVEYDK